MKKIRERLKGGGAFVLVVACSVFFVSVLGFLFLSWYRLGTKMDQLKSTRPTQFFAESSPFQIGDRYSLPQLKNVLEYQGYSEKKDVEDLLPREYGWALESSDTRELLLSRPVFEGVGRHLERLKVRIRFENTGDTWVITGMHSEQGASFEKFEMPPKRIGSYYAGRVRTQNPVMLSDIPVDVRHAVMAIEDIRFLEHKGVSIRGTLRALWRDLKERRLAEGGSTITQQLMKNLFFSREKALQRKIKEALYALLAEIFYSKEDILEAYLNEVYMGQWSTHEIHGVAEGARYYFNRPIAEISLSQSAVLAAIIQAPNALDPRKGLENTKKRRNLVLKKMLDAGFILDGEYQMAINDPIGTSAANENLEDVGYFMDLVLAKIPEWVKRRLDTDALTIYTTLNPYLQITASRSLKENLDRLVNGYASLKKKKQKGLELQSALIAIDIPNCAVLALQGGRSYRLTQFNRVLQGKRQPGSLFKPFVVLAALANPIDGKPVSPTTEIEGSQFEWKYDKQVWKPKNYENIYDEKVSVRKTLENSINVPTAKLAQMIGLPPILEALKAAGIRSPLPAVPSISLGSADVNPLEVAEAYLTLANLGKSCELRPIARVFDESGNIVFGMDSKFEEKLPAGPSFQVVNMLKGVLKRGTARFIANTDLKVEHFAGKTGTTNDFKDAWFVGFSPSLLTLVWVGYDEEEKVGLTGAAAAAPLWLDFTKAALPVIKDLDFSAPEGIVPYDIDPISLGLANNRCPDKVTEYFAPGTQPSNPCLMH